MVKAGLWMTPWGSVCVTICIAVMGPFVNLYVFD